MSIEKKKRIYSENLSLLNKSREWLWKSYRKAQNIDFSKKDLKEEEIEVLETLSNRFRRTVDILINKVLRGLDLIELEDGSKKLDIVIRAEKRGFINDYRLLIEMKDLRNELVHEYIQENLIEKFQEVIEKIPLLVDVINRVNAYSKKMNYLEL